MEKTKRLKGWNCLCFALCAFAGLGLEVVLAFGIEPGIYGAPLGEWLEWQDICHWIITCILWGIVGCLIVKTAKRRYDVDLFERTKAMSMLQWILVAACVIFSLVTSYLDWNGSKVIIEFQANGWLRFIFQYIYYIFETMLFMLIIVFGQKAFELWFRNDRIPYGGIVAAVTWGAAHFFTKGSITDGLLSILSGFLFGVAYLLVNRDIKKTYLLLFIMFVL